MIIEEFDRLEPDLTLNEIIEAARRNRLKKSITNRNMSKSKKGPYAPSMAERLRKLREALTHGTKPKPPVTHMNRSVLLRRITEFNTRLDRIIDGEEAGQATKEVTEFTEQLKGHSGRFADPLSVAAGLGKGLAFPKTKALLGAGAIGLAAGATGLVVHNTRKQNRWRASAGNNDFLKVGGAMAIDKHGALYPLDHPKVKKGKVTEFAFLPTLAGGVVGSGVGERLSGKKYNATTGKWEDAQGNEVSPPSVSSAAGGVAGAGAGFGLSKAHQAIMKGYGGADVGVKGAYGTAARSAGSIVGEKVSKAIGPTATTAAQDIYGAGKSELSDVLKKLRGAGTSALRKVFGANAPKQFVEFEARIDAILFARESRELTRKKKAEVTEFAQPTRHGTSPSDWRTRLPPQAEKKRSFVKPYLAGLLTVPAVSTAIAAAGPGRHMLAGAAEAIRARRYKRMYPAGSNIPANKVVEYLRMLHAGKIKV